MWVKETFQVTVISASFIFLRGEQRPEAATISDILYVFGQGNFIFIRELKVRELQKLMSVRCGFHALGLTFMF